MRAWLTMGEDGKGVLTGRPPIITRVMGTRRKGVYPQPGDWLLVRGLCLEGVKRCLGHVPRVNEPVEVELTLAPRAVLDDGLAPAPGRKEPVVARR